MSSGFISTKCSDKALETDGKMTLWLGEFHVAAGPPVLDTFLRLPGWRKGIAWVNGFNLGRYWPMAGPQVTDLILSCIVMI